MTFYNNVVFGTCPSAPSRLLLHPRAFRHDDRNVWPGKTDLAAVDVPVHPIPERFPRNPERHNNYRNVVPVIVVVANNSRFNGFSVDFARGRPYTFYTCRINSAVLLIIIIYCARRLSAPFAVRAIRFAIARDKNGQPAVSYPLRMRVLTLHPLRSTNG